MLPLELWYEIYNKLDDESLTNLLDVSGEWNNRVKNYLLDSKRMEKVMRFDIQLFKEYWNGEGYLEIIKKGCNLEVLEWIMENGGYICRGALEDAVVSGLVENVKWLIDNGCYYDEEAFAFALKGGNIEMMKLLLEEGCLYSAYVGRKLKEKGLI